jgi:hypothetical protein
LFDSREDGIISSTVAQRLFEYNCRLESGRHCPRRWTAVKMNKVFRGSTIWTRPQGFFFPRIPKFRTLDAQIEPIMDQLGLSRGVVSADSMSTE